MTVTTPGSSEPRYVYLDPQDASAKEDAEEEEVNAVEEPVAEKETKTDLEKEDSGKTIDEDKNPTTAKNNSMLWPVGLIAILLAALLVGVLAITLSAKNRN